MARIIVVTSGKGGVGKTTTAAAVAMGLAQRGHRAAVIDFDVGLRNLDLVMGCERRVVYDFVNVINGDANLNQVGSDPICAHPICEGLNRQAKSDPKASTAEPSPFTPLSPI